MDERKKGRSYTYILRGEPEALVLRRSDDIAGWNNSKERKLITNITLDSQHQDRPILTGALLLDVKLYFQVPKSNRSKRKAIQGDIYAHDPSIFLCLNFIEHSALGIIFSDSVTIAGLTCNKWWDEDPRTVITITELHEKKDNSPKKG